MGELFLHCSQWFYGHRLCVRPLQVLNPISALLIVDVQNDFISGSLALKNCPAGEDGEEVVSVIQELLSKKMFSVVAYSFDWHPSDHCSFVDNVSLYPLHSSSQVTAAKAKVFDVVVYDKIPIIDQVLWPRHCVMNSWGAELHKDLTVRKIKLLVTQMYLIEWPSGASTYLS